MFFFAKVVQLLGIANVGYALFVGVTQENGMGRELTWLMVGFLIFSLGRFLERRASPQG